MTDLKIGSHVPAADPIEEAGAREADVVQIFVGNTVMQNLDIAWLRDRR